MNFTVNEITNSIAGKPSLSECSTDELRQLASQYPFFGPAQFLYVKKLKEADSWQLKEQIQKASLYFQNPLWLNHLLNSTAAAPLAVAIKGEFITDPTAEMEVPVTHEITVDRFKNTNDAPFSAPVIKDEEFIPEPATEMKTPVIHEEIANQLPNTTAETPVYVAIKEEESVPEPVPEVEAPVIHEEISDQSPDTSAEVPVTEINKGEFIPKLVAEMETPFTHEEVVDQTSHTRGPELTETESQTEQDQTEPSLEMRKFKFEPIDVSKTTLTFEPYHTIDYFASQGIQPKLEEKPRDQFSRQLKSFTEWLKVMKKLPVTEIAAAVSVVDEKKVEKMAELSINDREVVTEAMAEVWEKQGNLVKAKETYEKLSLLNPGKSSYFAAKIEQLKNL
ncbi:MAG: hypothetical protein ABI675_04095 [Chitinophagaceae bacterium]